MEIQTKGASKKQAQIVLDCDLISEFRIIKELIQQRAELLEALKKILQNDGGHGSECFDALELHKGRNLGFAAINRAEAAE